MPSPSVTYTFVNGTPFDATEVNTNFTDLINAMSDGSKDFSINALTAAGTATLNGSVSVGNASADDLTVNASIASSLPVKTTNSYDVGSTSLALRSMYFASSDSAAFAQRILSPTIGANYSTTLPGHTVVLPVSDGAAKDILQTDGSGTWSFVGGPAITSKTTTYTATTADKIISVTTGSAWTLTMYAASSNAGRTLEVIKTSSDFNALTIDGNSSETINGATTYLLNTQYERVKLLCDGSNWLVIEHTIPSKWIAYTPTGTWSTNTTYTGFYKRSGDSVDLDLHVALTGTPTATFLGINLPSGLTIATSKLTNLGNYKKFDGGGTIYDGSEEIQIAAFYNSTSQLLISYYDDAASGVSFAGVTETAPLALGSGDYLTVRACNIPITDWEG